MRYQLAAFALLITGCTESNTDFQGDSGASDSEVIDSSSTDSGLSDSGLVCEPGTVEQRDCDQGVEDRRCEGGRWTDWGACIEQEACAEGAEEQRVCGLNDRGQASRGCVEGHWGAWAACDDPDNCEDGARDERACGLNDGGTQRRPCQNGRWRPWRACEDPNGCTGTEVGVEACGEGGERAHTCIGDHWGPWGPCLGRGDACDTVQYDVDMLINGQQFNFATEGLPANHNASCGSDAEGPEGVLRFRVADRVSITFEVTQATHDTVLHLRRICADRESEIACSDDEGAGSLSQLTATLDPGVYYLHVDGYGQEDAGLSIVEVRLGGEACDEPENAVDVRCERRGAAEYRTCRDGAWVGWFRCERRDFCERANDGCRQCWDDFEHNDTQNEAPLIEAERVYRDLRVCEILDPVDLYAFDTVRPSYVELRTRHDRQRPSVEVIDRTGQKVSGHDESGELSIFSTIIAEAGRNYVQISTPPGESSYSMLLSVTPIKACEWVDEPCFHCIDEAEPNNGRGEATPMVEGEWIQGMAVCANLNDIDVYQFEADGAQYRVELQRHQAYLGTISVRLLRDNGAEFPADVQIEGDRIRLDTGRHRGQLFIEVSTVDGAGIYQIRHGIR